MPGSPGGSDVTEPEPEYGEAIEENLRSIYTAEVVDHALHPRNLGEIAGAGAFGQITGPCGDTMAIWLSIEGGVVSGAGFETDGCAATIAAGSMATQLVTGKTVAEAMKIGQECIESALGGLPEPNRHCALLAAETVKKAVRQYLVFRKEPWKALYSKN
mgnify:CR=1 FL=1